jgi:5-methylcytosine-specific restriction endonuclease McrA
MVDAALVALWNAKKAASWKTKRTTLLAEKEALRRGWLVKYNAYLQGDEWRAKRVLVLRRADWTCEGCGNARATQVHHTTYDHAGNEFLWELVAVCDECHERFHGREIGEPDFE